ncbi:MAG: glycosyltransferase family 2 protein [Nanoarchaeota archaeon]|nr:glycosyltransferase family 2 protein [Nanoarchaeota archaeon]
MELIVTIPAFNEAKTLGAVLESIKKEAKCKILVVDDGSTDNTAEVARKAGAITISHPANLGLAEAFRTEMREVLKLKPDVIVHMDADGQYLAKEIQKLVKPVADGKADLVLGSRFLGKIESMPLLKRWGNKAFSRVISRMTRQRITDGQTGFRAFTPEVAKLAMDSQHTYTQEQIVRAARERMRIVEVPIYFARRDGKSRLVSNPFEYAVKAWITLLRIHRDFAPLKFFGLIGSLFMAVGFALGVWIVITLLNTGGVGGIPRVILSALFILTGIQIMLFGFLADMQRK